MLLDDDLSRQIRKETAWWTRTAAERFGITPREINQALHAQFGDVNSADLMLLFMRCSWVLDGLGTGEYTLTKGPATCEEPLEADRDITHRARLLNEQMAKLLNSRYSVAPTTINKAMKQQFGPLPQATTPQLVLRAAALLRAAATSQERSETTPEPSKSWRTRHRDRSSSWQALHRDYTDLVWHIVREHGLTAATVNSTMFRLRGSISSETEHSLPGRIELLAQTFQKTTGTGQNGSDE